MVGLKTGFSGGASIHLPNAKTNQYSLAPPEDSAPSAGTNCYVAICARVKIGAIRPNERVSLWINSNLIKKRLILKRAIEFSVQDRPEVDYL